MNAATSEARGFTVTGFYCQHPSCTARADGLAEDKGRAEGLPKGWVQVTALGYDSVGGQVTSAFRTIVVRHYCSTAHLPSELLPE